MSPTPSGGARAFAHRRAVSLPGPRGGRAGRWEAVDPRAGLGQRRGGGQAAPVAFLFPGSATTTRGWRRGLYADEPVFRREVDRGRAPAARSWGATPGAARPGGRSTAEPARARARSAADARAGRRPAAGRRGAGADRARPAGGLRRRACPRPPLDELGCGPAALLGYSLGEYAAACLAGVFRWRTACGWWRSGRGFVASLPAGAMLGGQPWPRRRRSPWLTRPACPSPRSMRPRRSVVAGPARPWPRLERRLGEGGGGLPAPRRSPRLPFRHDGAGSRTLRGAARARSLCGRPRVPFLSNVTGDLDHGRGGDRSRLLGAGTWAGRCVSESTATRCCAGRFLLLEVGPGQTLGGLARRQAGGGQPSSSAGIAVRLSAAAPGNGARRDVLLRARSACGWPAPFELGGRSAHERRQRVPLPTYPFERGSATGSSRGGGAPTALVLGCGAAQVPRHRRLALRAGLAGVGTAGGLPVQAGAGPSVRERLVGSGTARELIGTGAASMSSPSGRRRARNGRARGPTASTPAAAPTMRRSTPCCAWPAAP